MKRFLIAALLFASAGAGHELQDNRATLVLRDKTHISVTFYLAYSAVLHQTLAPQRPLAEFLAVYSSTGGLIVWYLAHAQRHREKR